MITRAIELQPGTAEYHLLATEIALSAGRLEEAEAAGRCGRRFGSQLRPRPLPPGQGPAGHGPGPGGGKRFRTLPKADGRTERGRSRTMKKAVLLLSLSVVHASGESGSFQFREGAAEAGIDFRFVSGSADKPFIIESISGGVALFDYDNDGWLDVYLVNGNTVEEFLARQTHGSERALPEPGRRHLSRRHAAGRRPGRPLGHGSGGGRRGQRRVPGSLPHRVRSKHPVPQQRRRHLPRHHGLVGVWPTSGGEPGPLSATTTRTACSTCTWPATSSSIHATLPLPRPSSAATGGSRSNADPAACRGPKIRSTETWVASGSGR